MGAPDGVDVSPIKNGDVIPASYVPDVFTWCLVHQAHAPDLLEQGTTPPVFGGVGAKRPWGGRLFLKGILRARNLHCFELVMFFLRWVEMVELKDLLAPGGGSFDFLNVQLIFRVPYAISWV